MIQIAIVYALILTSCVYNVDKDGKVSAPTPKPTPAQPVKPSPIPSPIPSPVPTPAPIAFKVYMPALVLKQCEPFIIRADAEEKDDVVIWAEQKNHIGRMFYDANVKKKYLKVTLNTAGKRRLDFKVNGEWKDSVTVEVIPSPSPCVP